MPKRKQPGDGGKRPNKKQKSGSKSGGKSGKPSRARNWAITLNNFTSLSNVKAVVENSGKYKWFIARLEKAPTTGRPHLQGACVFKNPQYRTMLEGHFGTNNHYEKMREPPIANRRYCTKKAQEEGLEMVEIGTIPQAQGARNDIHNFAEDVAAGSTWVDLAESHPGIILRYPSGATLLKQIADMKAAKENVGRKIKVVIHYGPTGTGKTTDVVKNTPAKDLYCIDPPYKWYCGYDREKVLCIEEYKGQLPLQELLKLLDGVSSVRKEKKCGQVYAFWDTVYITTNVRPSYWHLKCTDMERDALKRRISEIWKFDSNGKRQVNKNHYFNRNSFSPPPPPVSFAPVDLPPPVIEGFVPLGLPENIPPSFHIPIPPVRGTVVVPDDEKSNVHDFVFDDK